MCSAALALPAVSGSGVCWASPPAHCHSVTNLPESLLTFNSCPACAPACILPFSPPSPLPAGDLCRLEEGAGRDRAGGAGGRAR